jgi:phage replication O-like protein O
MADVQLENGYTRIANIILDVLALQPFNGTQWRIVCIVWRYTYGFSRKNHSLSESFIANATGIHKKQIQREMNVLINYGVLRVVKEASFTTPRIIQFNKNFDDWVVTKKLPPNKKDTHTGSELVTSTGSELVTQDKKDLKKILKKDLSLEIENFRHKFSDFLELVDEYFDILRTTRVSGKISDSVILKVYGQMDKHPVIVVKAALLTIIHNPALHSKRENYFYGIMRNTDAAEAERRIQKYEAMQPENQKPNEEYQRIKERLRDGSAGV